MRAETNKCSLSPLFFCVPFFFLVSFYYWLFYLYLFLGGSSDLIELFILVWFGITIRTCIQIRFCLSVYFCRFKIKKNELSSFGCWYVES